LYINQAKFNAKLTESGFVTGKSHNNNDYFERCAKDEWEILLITFFFFFLTSSVWLTLTAKPS
jgi:hypothetical protein